MGWRGLEAPAFNCTDGVGLVESSDDFADGLGLGFGLGFGVRVRVRVRLRVGLLVRVRGEGGSLTDGVRLVEAGDDFAHAGREAEGGAWHEGAVDKGDARAVILGAREAGR
eukprot:6001426-Prymnesium_polylepis.1